MGSILNGVEGILGIPNAQSSAVQKDTNAATNYYTTLGNTAASNQQAFTQNVNPLLQAYTSAAGIGNLPGYAGNATAGGGTSGPAANAATAGQAGQPSPYTLTPSEQQELQQQQTSYMTSVNNQIASMQTSMANQGYGPNSPEVAQTKVLMQQVAANQQAAMQAAFTANAQQNAQTAALQGLQFFAGLQQEGQQGLGTAAAGSQALANTAQQQLNQSENLVAGLGGMALTGGFNNLFGGGGGGGGVNVTDVAGDTAGNVTAGLSPAVLSQFQTLFQGLGTATPGGSAGA